MQENTNKGLLSELYCELAFTSYGITVLKPLSSDCRYDYVVDIDNKLYRIQVKTSVCTKNNSFSIRTATKNWNTNTIHTYSTREIDGFFTRFGEIDYLYLLDDEEVLPKKEMCFSLSGLGTRNAKEFEFDFVMKNTFHKEKLSLIPSEETLKEKREKNGNICIDCGAIISNGATRCRSCAGKMNAKNSKKSEITKEQLKNDLRTMPSICSIGKKYGVSDTTIKHWCISYGLPEKIAEVKLISDEDWADF